MRLNVGEIRSNLSGFNSIACVAKKASELQSDSFELDFSGCDFFEANMAAPLYSVIAKLRDGLRNVSICNLPSSIETILKKNHFLSIFNIAELADTNQTTFPFKIFKLHAGDQFSDYLNSYLKGRGIPKMSEALTKRFKQSLFEIFQNAAIHSQSEAGVFVCGQFFPTKHRLDFTISDAGIGIRENVRKYNKNEKMSSCEAIDWALTEGNTTKAGHQPGGLGLKLLKDFIQINKGKLQIVSRDGYHEFMTSEKSSTKIMEHDFQGTCVNIEINTQDTNSYCLKSELNGKNIF